MGVDLALIGSRYSIIVLVFFLSYVFLQPPATVVLRKVGPRIFLPTITLLWGITMMGMGFVKTWTQMIPLRIVLGIFEAGFFPGRSCLSKVSEERKQENVSLTCHFRLCISPLLLVPEIRAAQA